MLAVAYLLLRSILRDLVAQTLAPVTQFNVRSLLVTWRTVTIDFYLMPSISVDAPRGTNP